MTPCRSLMSRYKHLKYGYQHTESSEFISALQTGKQVYIPAICWYTSINSSKVSLFRRQLYECYHYIWKSQGNFLLTLFDILPSCFLKVKRFKDIQSYSFTCRIQAWNLVSARNKGQKLSVFRNRVLTRRICATERLNIN